MGATVSTPILQDHQRITTGRAAPSFFRYLRRIILTILVVGGSYFVVREGLRFYAEQKALFVKQQIEKELGDFSFSLDEKTLGLKNLSEPELQKVLYLTADKLTRCQMAVASIEEISRGVK